MGLRQIENVFKRQKERPAIFIPYFMYGYPGIRKSEQLISGACDYADIIEIGIAFSDPLADGPVIQAAGETARKKGATIQKALSFVKRLHKQSSGVPPLLFMTYYNLLLAYGIKKLCRDCRNAGVSGFIVPDVPPEEASVFSAAAEQNGLAVIFLIGPNATKIREQVVLKHAQGFIYYVAYTGVTGQAGKQPAISLLVKKLKKQSGLPVCVGFGVKNNSDFQRMSRFADGVIVGSELIRIIDKYKHTDTIRKEILKIVR